MLFVGDLMLGRRVGELAALDPASVFEDVRTVVGGADVALANLESPLTARPHESANVHHLEADPALASLIAAAGFDIVGIANNHAGDAGAASVMDTIAAVSSAGMQVAGGGSELAAAWRPVLVDVHGTSVAVLAVDVSAQGLAAGAEPGVAVWNPNRARAAVTEARANADVVVVGIHGGTDEWIGTDPILDPVARDLARWGADVVWGHGPHVAQPVVSVEGVGGRTAVLATSLGNFLFDQQNEPNSIGIVLETMVDDRGLVAWRLGRSRNDDLRVHFEEWLIPDGDAVLLDGDWWSVARRVEVKSAGSEVGEFEYGDVVAASTGNLSADGPAQLLVSYRHAMREYEWDPRPREVDQKGRTTHIGVFELDGTPVWMSHRPPAPVADLVACGGSAIFAYSEIDDPEIVAVGAGVWNGFGFTLAPELAGGGTIGCVDIDNDGQTEPAVVGRS
jgi:poly-gamma-glutamate synthesis protein (capsule biosynthesis protein)